ncbi:MAG: tetratricopeptide repeat protein, partial [Nitrospirota bacterium]|nr:tetratricopeptide repeat protein [Nitrospirota bacterium]
MQEAKRKALELAGTYVASLTEVKDYRLTKDEVTAYTAGIIETEVIAEEMRGTAQRPEIFTKVRCRIDTSTLTRQIENYRENDDLKAQLEATARENAALRKERDQLVSRLQTEKNTAKTEETKKQLAVVLSREESNDEVSKLWNQLAYRVTDIDIEMNKQELAEAAATVAARVKADPKNTRARFLLAMIYHRQGDLKAAEQEARDGLSLAPDSPQLRLKLAAVLKERRRFDEALKELQIVERSRPNDPNMLFHIGMIHAANDNCGKATSYLQRFLAEAKKTEQPVGERKKRRAARAIKECDRGELEPRRRR